MFATDNLPLAAYLVTKGYKHSTVHTVGTDRVVFNFDDSALEKVDAYHDGRALCNPAAFERTRIQLRREIERLLTKGD